MQRPLAGCLAALAISVATIPAARSEIRIGLATPLSGHFAWAGEQTRAGAEAAVQDLNDHGGVLGEAFSQRVGRTQSYSQASAERSARTSSFFSRTAFTSRSSALAFSPTTIPS